MQYFLWYTMHSTIYSDSIYSNHCSYRSVLMKKRTDSPASILFLTLHLHQTHSPPPASPSFCSDSAITDCASRATLGNARQRWEGSMSSSDMSTCSTKNPGKTDRNTNPTTSFCMEMQSSLSTREREDFRIFPCAYPPNIWEFVPPCQHLVVFSGNLCCRSLFRTLKKRDSCWSLKKKGINFSFDEMQAKFQC